MLNAADHVFMLVLAHIEHSYGSGTDRLSGGHEGSPFDVGNLSAHHPLSMAADFR